MFYLCISNHGDASLMNPMGSIILIPPNKLALCAGSQAPALIVIHKSRWAKNAGLLQPGGLPAISRGLSEATPPEHTKYRASTPEGSQQSDAAKKFRHSPKAVRMVLSGKWHPAPDKKDCDPSRGR